MSDWWGALCATHMLQNLCQILGRPTFLTFTPVHSKSPYKHYEVRLQLHAYLQKHLLGFVQHLPSSEQQQLRRLYVHTEMHIPQHENLHLSPADIVPEEMLSLGT